MGMNSAKLATLVALNSAAVFVLHPAALAADYPNPPPQPQYYQPQPVYQPPPPVYQPQPVYQAPQPQPVYVPPPQPVYTPPPVYVPPPVYQAPPPPVIPPPTPVVYQNSGHGSVDCCGDTGSWFLRGSASGYATGGWYIRADIGMTNQDVDHLDNALYPGSGVVNQSKEFDSGMLIGAGLGYQFNNWLRADFTGEYRGKTAFRGLDLFPGQTQVDDYYGSKSEWLYLANVYFDLGTWSCFTPFVGVGVGMAKVTIHDFRDVNVATSGLAYASDASQWNLAWAFHAGVAYEISQNLMLELSYRYVNLGDGTSGDLITYSGINNVNNPMLFKDITSQDIRLGLRWKFDCCALPPPPPPVVYQPPPQVYQPPLMRRG